MTSHLKVKLIRHTAFMSLLLAFPFFLTSQDSGDKMFDTSILHEIRIEFTQDNFWNILINNYESNADPFADKPYLMAKVTIDGESVDSVGVRLKGFSSYWTNTQKKPLKLDFNEFVPGQRFDGLRKLNLNNSTGDPGMQREYVCYDLMRSSGVKAPRVSFSEVFMNDQYWGIYQSVEQVDKEFLQNNFSNDQGNLFKNLSWSKLEYNGNTTEDYNTIFSLKTNEEANDWSGFIHFVDVLNNATDEEFKEKIEEVFNVDLFLKTLAVDVTTNNWDSYLEHGRNWYMYEDPGTGRFHWIPWDYNFALPREQEIDPEECTIFPDFVPFNDGTTTVQFFNNSFSINPIESYTWDFGDGNTSDQKEPIHTYNNSGTYQVCLTINSGPDCEESLCRSMTTTEDLNNCAALDDKDFDHEVGRAFAFVVGIFSNCCDQWNEDCEEFYGLFSGEGGFGIRDFPIDQRENQGILIRRLLNEEEYFERYLGHFCNLLEDHFDVAKYENLIDVNADLIEAAVQSDPNLLATYQEFLFDVGPDGIKRILAQRYDSLAMELMDYTACEASPTIPMGDLVINELVASNDSTSSIADQAGDFDDWIEIYNKTDHTINLSDAYLSDDPANLLKWRFPIGTTVGPDGYKIVWADKEEDQPGLHANFRLSKSGDQIFLTNSDGSLIDEVQFIEQQTNVALARIPNGTGEFTNTTTTFKANNDTGEPTGIEEEFYAKVTISPNPVTSYLNVDIEGKKLDDYSIGIYNTTGQLVHIVPKSEGLSKINVTSLPRGFYILAYQNNKGLFGSAKFIKE